MNITELTTKELTDQTNSIEEAMSIIAKQMQKPEFATLMRNRMASGLDLEYKLSVKKRGNDYAIFWSYRKRASARPILIFNHVQ